MSRMDTVVAKLKSRETKLTENLDKIVEKSEVHEGHLVTVQVGIFEVHYSLSLQDIVPTYDYCRIFWERCKDSKRCLTVQDWRESAR